MVALLWSAKPKISRPRWDTLGREPCGSSRVDARVTLKGGSYTAYGFIWYVKRMGRISDSPKINPWVCYP